MVCDGVCMSMYAGVIDGGKSASTPPAVPGHNPTPVRAPKVHLPVKQEEVNTVAMAAFAFSAVSKPRKQVCT